VPKFGLQIDGIVHRSYSCIKRQTPYCKSLKQALERKISSFYLLIAVAKAC